MKAIATRRSILKGVAAAAGSAAIGAPGLLLAQTQPIKIGVTNALSGPNALYGESNVMGQRLVVAQYNKAGGVLGAAGGAGGARRPRADRARHGHRP